LVTGWRDWPAEHAYVVWAVLQAIHERRPVTLLIHGDCPYGGVDVYAQSWAQQRGVPWQAVPARRSRGGYLLGAERNTKMVRDGADECVGFPGPESRGSWDCLRKAVDAGIQLAGVIGWWPGIPDAYRAPA